MLLVHLWRFSCSLLSRLSSTFSVSKFILKQSSQHSAAVVELWRCIAPSTFSEYMIIDELFFLDVLASLGLGLIKGVSDSTFNCSEQYGLGSVAFKYFHCLLCLCCNLALLPWSVFLADCDQISLSWPSNTRRRILIGSCTSLYILNRRKGSSSNKIYFILFDKHPDKKKVRNW